MAYPTYPQAYPQMFQNYPQSQSTNGINWVQGIEGAKAWQLQPNSNIILLDSENAGKMYIKTTDNVGISSLRMFEYTEVTEKTEVVPSSTLNNDLDLSQFVRKDELNTFIKELIEEHERVVSTAAGVSAATESGAAAE